jgi:hypothetical protein
MTTAMTELPTSARRASGLWALISLLIVGTPSRALAESLSDIEYGAAEVVAILDLPALKESSGLAASRLRDDMLWTHNDSGDGPRLYAIGTNGEVLGTCDVKGAKALDWEDMASYRQGGRGYLLVGDVGNNRRSKKISTLYRIPERPPELGALEVDRIVQYRYDLGPCDCEALAFDATRDEVLLIDKGWNLQCRVFVLKWPTESTLDPVVASHIADVKIAGITGMDVAGDGCKAIVSTYGPAYEFTKSPDEDWSAAFRRAPREIELPFRKQGEAICYGADGRTIFLTSEKLPTPLLRVPPLDDQRPDSASTGSSALGSAP